ncbi:hypothetical protein BH09SUM1_BH09SUM1_18160 [soil metagenome]
MPTADVKTPEEAPLTAIAEPPASAVMTSRRVVVVVISAVFVMFEGSVFLLFGSGESINWKRELTAIDSDFMSGEASKAATELEEFAVRWPGAAETFDYNRKLGQYHAAAGEWKAAGDSFAKAVAIDDANAKRRGQPVTAGVRARAGEALWKSDRRAEAVKYLAAEIAKTERTAGDHDRANVYLGLSLQSEGRLPEAFQHFQSVTDRGAWKAEFEQFYAQVDTDFLKPTREDAKKATLAEVR